MQKTVRFWRKIFWRVVIYGIWQLSPSEAKENSPKSVISTRPSGYVVWEFFFAGQYMGTKGGSNADARMQDSTLQSLMGATILK